MAAMAQFGIRTLFMITTVCAVLVWAVFSPPQWLGLLVLFVVYSLAPAVTVAGVVFHRGYWQAFFVGCAPAVVYTWWGHFMATYPTLEAWPIDVSVFSQQADEMVYEKMKLSLPLAIFGASGLVAVGMRWWALALTRDREQT